jgi:hypothetical protein
MTAVTCPVWSRDFWVAYTVALTPMYPHAKFGEKVMIRNGLELSGEKTCLVLFNNGDNPTFLPEIKLDNNVLNYNQSVKFLGVFLSRNLSWKTHIDYILTESKKRLNFLKLISAQPWSQDTNTLLHLANALIRSKLAYGQEVYFSAQYLLRYLQSIDVRAIKIALGVPVQSSTIKVYSAAQVIPLFEFRKLSIANYVLRSLSVPNSVSSKEHKLCHVFNLY